MKYLVLIISFPFFYGCSVTNNGTSVTTYDISDMPTGPGCYAKCIIPDEYAKAPWPIIEYTGDDYDDPNVRKDTLILQEPRQVWVKKEDQQGESKWILEDEAGQYIDYYTIVDTSLSKEFIINNNFEKEVIVKKGGYTAWQEVVCDNDISPKLYSDIYDVLILKGYVSENENQERGTFGASIKQGLVQYQKDHDLPVGQLNLETIKHLGIK